MYSTGLPILYPFACIFYFVLYWVYKLLLVKYYETTTTFNEMLPLYTIKWIKAAYLVHLIIASLMLTNSNVMPQGEQQKEDMMIFSLMHIQQRFF